MAGCGSGDATLASAPGQADATGDSINPPPKTERAKKAADFEQKLKSQTRRD